MQRAGQVLGATVERALRVMGAVCFILIHYAAVALLALVSFVIGKRLTRRLEYNNFAEEVAFCVALGLGAIAYGVLFLGLIGGLYAWVVISVVALLIGIACRTESAGLFPRRD